MKNYIYDLETYPNLFFGVFNTEGKETVFEISARKNDYEKLLEFYTDKNIKYAIGFNNIKFDAQILHYLVSNKELFIKKQGSELVSLIFLFAQKVISSTYDGGFPPYTEWNFGVKQIDLFLINHYLYMMIMFLILQSFYLHQPAFFRCLILIDVHLALFLVVQADL